MGIRMVVLGSILTFLAVWAGCSVEHAALATDAEAGRAEQPVPEGERGTAPVVLELFTSQGCSSCPAADAVLSKLGASSELRGRVVPLAFHVDYWNYIGWSDPFSSKAWTERQYAYGRALEQDNVYTPELVVNGRLHLNGSNERGILAEIDRASRAPNGKITVKVDRGTPGQIVVDALAEIPSDLDASRLEAYVVLFENDVTTSVRRGENGGRTLHNDFIVRRFERAFSIGASKGSTANGTVKVSLDSDWKTKNLGVAAFLQDPTTMRIYGAAVE